MNEQRRPVLWFYWKEQMAIEQRRKGMVNPYAEAAKARAGERVPVTDDDEGA